MGLAPVLLVMLAAAPEPNDPRSVVREATRAVENERGAEARAAWQARLDHDPTDRAALLGLAMLARPTYDYPAAEALYRNPR